MLVLTCVSVDEVLEREHQNESYLVVVSFGSVYYIVQGCSYFKPVCGETLRHEPGNESY